MSVNEELVFEYLNQGLVLVNFKVLRFQMTLSFKARISRHSRA